MTKRLLRFSYCFLLLLSYQIGWSQGSDNAGIDNIGLGVQIYPAGTIINAKVAWPLSEKGLFVAKLGYNLAERQDFGEHDQEDGGGPGITAAYKHYLKQGFKGFFLESRLSAWFLSIDWRDNDPVASGNTDITVIQPTLAIGYDFLLKGDQIKLGLMAAAGYELNMITSGQKVGQGGISLFGASFSFRIGQTKRNPVTKAR